MSPSVFNCSLEQGQASAMYYLSPVTNISTIYAATIEILGNINLAPSASGLIRQTPMLHPWLPFYAQSISTAQGMGGNMQIVPTNPSPFLVQPSAYVLPQTWHFNINFTQRKYPIYSNAQINIEQTGTYIDDANVTQEYPFYLEYERFVEINQIPDTSTVASQTGQMAFNASNFGNAKVFNAMPRLYLNNARIKMIWHTVPYRYYTSTNSYLKGFVGRVNQQDWNTFALGFFPKGSLLYLGCSPKNYRAVTQGINFVQLTQALDQWSLFCDFELDFLWTNRPRGANPQYPPPVQSGWVPFEHNLQPYLGKAGDPLSGTFLYASTCDVSKRGSTPLWRSYPAQCLFCDPDSADAAF